ncbi:DUF4142 domain-containing protein [Rufibacter roseus]|uniref:DUF4142 domain-containing protein n=1 Tax=Rufibacter roseus TaxID=1567108 RepID=A0ABW2DJE5_9BACT|nr:DUF4142 domain-containing protein [Rufibacter roseus]
MKKNNIWVLVWIFLVSCASLNACSESDEENTGSEVAETQEFLKKALAHDLFEITAGMMAEDQSKNGEVGGFGQQLVHVHTRTSEALQSIARRKSVQLPDQMPADKKSIINRLEEKEGTEFDQNFAAVQITAHQEVISMYEEADKKITDPEIQGFIDQILPVLQEHLAEIQKVQTQLIAKN